MDSTPKKRKKAYQWAHVGTGDMMMQAVGRNLPRIRSLKRGLTKDLVPVIAKDEKTFQDLTHSKQDIMKEALDELTLAATTHGNAVEEYKKAKEARQQFKKMLDSDYVPKGDPSASAKPFNKNVLNGRSPRFVAAFDKAKSDKDYWKAAMAKAGDLRQTILDRYNAASTTDILRTSDVRSPDPKETKLYILGHGQSGVNYISPTHSIADAIPLSTVASGLAGSGLKTALEDVRLFSCHSADITTPTALHPHVVSPVAPAGLSAPAQTLANALAGNGVANPRVTGYHGIGKVYPSGTTQVRRPNESSPPSSEVRASSVKKVFEPEKK